MAGEKENGRSHGSSPVGKQLAVCRLRGGNNDISEGDAIANE